MWQEGKHAKFLYFWTDYERGLNAGINSGGKFILWSEDGRYDAVQCEDLNKALAIMKRMIYSTGEKNE